MRGYWNNPEETTLAFRDGLFRTGDVGYRDADGYFYILDRLNRHSPDKCRLKTTLRLFVVIGKPGSPRVLA